MGIFQDLYIKRLTQPGSVQNPPLAIQSQSEQQPQQQIKTRTVFNPRAQQDQQEMPQVDTSNAIQSMAQLLGPTPAEREAQERRLLENKRKMIGWTALFDGLRQLGNLYAVSKGASPQQYTDKPYQTIEQNYQQDRQLQDSLNRYSQAYAQQLYNLQRQADQDQIRKEAHQAQMKYYENRDELAQQKAELEKMKAVRVIKQKDGSLMRFDPVSGSIEPLSEADPLYVEYMNSLINAANKRAGLIGAPSKKARGKSIPGYTKADNKGGSDGKDSKGRKGKAYGNGRQQDLR